MGKLYLVNNKLDEKEIRKELTEIVEKIDVISSSIKEGLK